MNQLRPEQIPQPQNMNNQPTGWESVEAMGNGGKKKSGWSILEKLKGTFGKRAEAKAKAEAEAERPKFHFNLPESSEERHCNYTLEYIKSQGKWETINDYVDEKLKTEPKEYSSVEEFYEDNPGYGAQMRKLSYKDSKNLFDYTGYDFRGINILARGYWDYEKLGQHTEEKEARYRGIMQGVSEAIPKAPAPNEDFVTFRGTDLSTFREYGIQTLQDLKKMQGQFFMEKGFMSSSLTKEASFYERNLENTFHGKRNVEICCHIPAGCHESAFLMENNVTDAQGQQEVLINRNCLFLVSDVMNTTKNTGEEVAIVDMLLIPRELYEAQQ